MRKTSMSNQNLTSLEEAETFLSERGELNAKDVLQVQKTIIQLLAGGKITSAKATVFNKGLSNYVGVVNGKVKVASLNKETIKPKFYECDI